MVARLSAFAALAASLALAMPARGQDGETPEAETIPVHAGEPEPPPPEAPVQLDDLVVTATKREQSVREIAGSVHALEGDDLEQIGARELKDFIQAVPGITVQEGVNNAWRKITIRGIGPGDRVNQTTGQLIGDVPMTDPYAAYVVPDPDPFDLRTVEVLKGPQGTVFGASALNGAIRYVPNPPELGEWSGRAFADYSSVNEGGRAPAYGAVLNAPLGESAALRGALVTQRIPGVYDNVQRGIEDADHGGKTAGRALARWEPTARLSLNALYFRQRSEVHDRSVATNLEERLEGDSRPGASHLGVGFDLANLDARYAFDTVTLVSQTSRLAKRADISIDVSDTVPALGGAGIESLRFEGHPRIRGIVQELRAQSPETGNWRWIAGAFFEDYEAFLDPAVTSGGNELGATRVRPLAAREEALFGEASHRFTPQWEVSAGARFYRTLVEGDFELSGLATTTPGGETRRLRQREEGISPRLALSFAASPETLLYAVAARGFQFGGVNFTPPTLPTVEIPPEYASSSLHSYEAGIRTDWFGRTLRADLTVFHLDWSDAQVSQLTPEPDETIYVDNVGTVRSDGVEVAFAWQTPIAGLKLGTDASWIVARTTEPYANESGSVPAGSAMPGAPRLQTATTLGYTSYVGAWIAAATLSHGYTGKAYSNLTHDHEIYDYHGVNLVLNAVRPGLRYAPEINLAFTNLLDERGLLGRTGTGDRPNSYYNRPRTLNLRLTGSF